jgi:hypothetical protein
MRVVIVDIHGVEVPESQIAVGPAMIRYIGTYPVVLGSISVDGVEIPAPYGVPIAPGFALNIPADGFRAGNGKVAITAQVIRPAG